MPLPLVKTILIWLLALPLLHNYSVHNSAIQDVVHVIFVQVPEAVVPLIVCLAYHAYYFIRVIVHFKHLSHLLANCVFHYLARVLRVSKDLLDLINGDDVKGFGWHRGMR